MTRRHLQAIRNILLSVVAASLLLGAGWWAGQNALFEPSTSPDSTASSPVIARVVQAEVGRVLNVGVTVELPTRLVATNSLAGIITGINPASIFNQADTLYSVSNTPVRAVSGDVPFYRPLTQGDQGADVSQLQTALRNLGYMTAQPTGRFGAVTTRAVMQWQEDLRLPATGIIALGELVAVPSLPSVLTLGEDIVLGGAVSGGEEAVVGPAGEPRFTAVLSAEQSRQIPVGTAFHLQYGDQSWTAVSAGSGRDESGNDVLTLAGTNGGSICGDQCSSLPLASALTLSGEALVVPPVSGPAVPAAAVRTDASGQPYVLDAGGDTRQVTVRGSGQGLVIVDGVAVGDRIIVSEAPTDTGD